MRRLVVLTLVLALALSPRPLMGQEEGRGGVRTGVFVGTAASSLAMTGLCAAGYIGEDNNPYQNHFVTDFVICPIAGALYGFIPALASGYGLSYPDRATGKGRLRTLALGTAGGFLAGAVIWGPLQTQVGTDSESGDDLLYSTAVLYATLSGAGIGLLTAFVGPSIQAYLYPSPAPPEARNASPPALGLALRFPLP